MIRRYRSGLPTFIIMVSLHGYNRKEPGVDFPNQFTNRADLIEHCTIIMFTGSAQHAQLRSV